MINVYKLKGRMTEMRHTQGTLAVALGMNRSTLNRKINNVDGETLTVKEANLIAKVLDITSPNDYFFWDPVADTQQE